MVVYRVGNDYIIRCRGVGEGGVGLSGRFFLIVREVYFVFIVDLFFGIVWEFRGVFFKSFFSYFRRKVLMRL